MKWNAVYAAMLGFRRSCKNSVQHFVCVCEMEVKYLWNFLLKMSAFLSITGMKFVCVTEWVHCLLVVCSLNESIVCCRQHCRWTYPDWLLDRSHWVSHLWNCSGLYVVYIYCKTYMIYMHVPFVICDIGRYMWIVWYDVTLTVVLIRFHVLVSTSSRLVNTVVFSNDV